jgi:hypothetical protein
MGTAGGRAELIAPLAAIGGNRIASGTPALTDLRPAANTMQAPPPPIPAREGKVAVRANPKATAASAALPPRDSTSRAINAARGSSAATPPRKPWT